MATPLHLVGLAFINVILSVAESSYFTNYPNLPGVVTHSIRVGVSELHRKKQLEERLFHMGNDRRLSGGHVWHHARFMFSSDRGKISQLSDKAFIVLRSAKEFMKQTRAPLQVIQHDPFLLKEWRKQIAPHCSCPKPKCNPKDIYRTADGTCNNLNVPTWGAAMKPQLRFLPAHYADGVNKPRCNGVGGKPLPSPRLISNLFHNTRKRDFDSNAFTVLFMTYGQFIDHDFIGTPMSKGFNNSDIMCCNLTESFLDQRGACFPIHIPFGDSRFHNKKCMNFVRSTIAPNENCDPDVRNQLNQHTSVIDGSVVYGSAKDHQNRLRVGHGGFLKMSGIGFMPPTEDDNKCMIERPGEYCFDAGDDRNSVVPTLATLHTLFLREHNRLAKALGYLNPKWNDEKIFQEVRKIVAAMLQHITYNHYLPAVVGKSHMKAYGLFSKPKGYSTVYNPKVNPTVSNAFGVAAFRFGHSQIPNLQGQIYNDFKKVKAVPMEQTFNRPSMLFDNYGRGCDRIGYWQANSVQSKQDRLLQDSVRNYLFLDNEGNSFDLAALNIQRGRDHGIPSYNAWRKFCGLPPAYHFMVKSGGLINHDFESAKRLSKIYQHPDDIDLFTGGISELLIPGGLSGPTFACIIAKQFENMKKGDRFWYENKFKYIGFSEAQLNEIKKVRLSHLMCRNMAVRQLQPRVLEVPSKSNPRIPCHLFPDLDLRYWIENKDSFHSYGPQIFRMTNFYVPNNPIPFWNAKFQKKHLKFSDVYSKYIANSKHFKAY